VKRFPFFVGLLLGGAALGAAEAPPPSADASSKTTQDPQPRPADDAAPGKTDGTPPPKHRLGGAFKGHPMAASAGSGETAKPSSKPPAAASGKNGKKKSSMLVIDNAMVRGAAADEKRSSGPRPAETAAPAAPAPAPPVAMPRIVDLQGHDETYWRAKAAATRDAVQKAQDTLAAAEAEEKREENDFYSWDDGQYRDNVIKPAWDRAKEETIKAHGDLDAARKQLDNLEDEARRAGAYPGWIR